ncbi:MAG TPA: alpha-amylase family glycosyl hydrolase [Chitinophagaceae bacterium]|nr:alpha-amylase family glycosyl hydrolase [Chitinophagaceae bacterium]
MFRQSPIFRLCFYCLFVFASCNSGSANNETQQSNPVASDVKLVDGHPDWIMQGNIYEVNVRQYTPEGTFKSFEKSLDRLKEMGAQTLWFMPINPISKVDRKGALGSYYAVSDYTQINPEFGTLEDWKELVKHAHDMGFKVIIDWVPNHSGADNRWLTEHPDFYVKDSTGKAAVAHDWTDTRKLDYKNMVLQDSMMSSMKYWITESDIDGFRCDVAGDVPDEFWKKCIRELKKTKANIFMLAEADKPSLHDDGFDATYAWAMFAMMKKVAKGERSANALDSVRNKFDTTFPVNSLKMFFTSNHDENSWNKADYGTMPGSIHAPFAVFTQTMPNDVPLIYSGQEEPVLDSISFFYKDPIHFKNYGRAKFYKTLLELRKNNPALSANASFKKIDLGNDKSLYAYMREGGGKKIMVILNLSPKEQKIRIGDVSLMGNVHNVFMGTNEQLTNKEWKLEPWGYVVYTY